MSNDNGTNGKKPTVDQRRAMANLAEEYFSRKIQEARDAEGDLLQEITGELRKQVGVDAIDHQIKTRQNEIKILEDKKANLGWGYGGFLETSKAGKLLKGRVAKQSTGMKKLEAQRKAVLTGIWTADSVEELEELVENL